MASINTGLQSQTNIHRQCKLSIMGGYSFPLGAVISYTFIKLSIMGCYSFPLGAVISYTFIKLSIMGCYSFPLGAVISYTFIKLSIMGCYSFPLGAVISYTFTVAMAAFNNISVYVMFYHFFYRYIFKNLLFFMLQSISCVVYLVLLSGRSNSVKQRTLTTAGMGNVFVSATTILLNG